MSWENKMKVVKLSIVALLLFPALAGATVYYVDHQNGSDSYNGQSQTVEGGGVGPWKHCPGMAGWSGSAPLRAGDTIYFHNRGAWSTGSGPYLLQPVGGVIYDGSTWGTGARAKLEATGDVDAIVRFTSDHASYETVVKGFGIDGNDYSATGVSFNYPYAARNLAGMTKRVEDCVVHDTGGPSSGYVYGIVIGSINGYTTSNVEVINCIVHDVARSGIVNYPSNDSIHNKTYNVLIRGCEVYNTGQLAGSGGHGIMLKNHVVNSTVEFCYVHDTEGGGLDIDAHGSLPGVSGPENAIFRYNIVTRCGDGFSFYQRGDKSVDVYGNIFYGNKGYGIVFYYTLSDNFEVKVYNNTLYGNCQAGGSAEIMIGNWSATASTFELKNNIIYANGRFCLKDADGREQLTDHSNNLYYSNTGNLVSIGGIEFTSADIHSWETVGVQTSYPDFKDLSNLPTGFRGTYGIDMVPNADGLCINSGEAIDNGEDLGVSYNGAINLSGTSDNPRRPRGGGFDIGAYEQEGGLDGEAPAPPQGLAIVSS